MSGFGKVSSSVQKHIDDGHIKPGSSVVPLRILGILEMLGCVGIIVPWLSGILPILTPITALCFCLIMLGALVIHAQKKEYKFLPLPIVIIVLAAMVAYYRFGS
ncbi:MAG: DoxX family protein [Bacteroidia bacterium]